MMEWNKLLTRQRLGKTESERSEDARTAFQRDCDRLIFSSPFRRLKDKTQVFSLSQNDYIRTRLVHSIEVSCVGRSLGTIVGYEIINRHGLQEFMASDFGDIISAACLAHDLGNPPFGHAGEDAIRDGFQRWYKITNQDLNPGQKADLDRFEGNAQGFRLLSRLEMQPQKGGMRLTCPTLAAFMKYPKESFISPEIINDKSGKSLAKHGFFQSEKDLFTTVAETVGLIQRHPDYAWWVRHPLAFLVEAADDICYNIVDLEDGYRMGFIPFDKACKLLTEIVELEVKKTKQAPPEERIKFLRAMAINKLVQEVAKIFLEHEQDLLAGTFDRELDPLSSVAPVLQEIQKETQNKVFMNPAVVGIQIAGYEVLGTLFEEFANATIFDSKKGKGNLLRHMLPPEYRSVEDDTCYDKILKITDYISGMTDSYATTLFQKIKGISLK